jgi:N-ethylmaleimide reductase
MFTPQGLAKTITPHALTRAQIAGIVADFARGAAHARAAGFDGVEIHSSNGYLFHQFFSSCSNVRDDEYGGSPENRARFFFEVLEAVGRELPFDRIGFRLNPMLNKFHGIVVDEHTVPTWEYIIRRANQYGLAYLHLTEPVSPKQIEGNPHGLADVGQYFRPLATMPLISNGNLTRETGEARLQGNLCDAVAYGKAWIANPDLVERFARDAELNVPDVDTFYQGGERGYLDYPSLSACSKSVRLG